MLFNKIKLYVYNLAIFKFVCFIFCLFRAHIACIPLPFLTTIITRNHHHRRCPLEPRDCVSHDEEHYFNIGKVVRSHLPPNRRKKTHPSVPQKKKKIIAHYKKMVQKFKNYHSVFGRSSENNQN
jgi:hypothetical protein